ncbi:MAG: YigZ family protein [Mobilibacterium timonense]|uniref:YigZ family protein n=1 Tax=Mobilibacterium timonense TaxID=1871012 RepID=UPI0009874ACF|nr:YigZ family protein [Mobilibacterium timonense]MBM6990887.1 YigZ family protein [Mobilibacterium timonense]
MLLYRSVFGPGEAEEIINRSRFIAHVSPVSNDVEAREFISVVKEKYKDATHNVPAFVVGKKQELQWASDDGEPQGTSGPPILKLITDSDLTDMVVVVTRYFGGVKLGTGGLVRAYSSVAEKAIENAGVCTVNSVVKLKCRIDYSFLEKIKSMEKDGSFSTGSIEYTDKVTIELIGDAENAGDLRKMLADVTSGRGEILDSTEGVQRIRV